MQQMQINVGLVDLDEFKNQQTELLTNFLIISENTRKKLSENLKSTLGTLEESQN